MPGTRGHKVQAPKVSKRVAKRSSCLVLAKTLLSYGFTTTPKITEMHGSPTQRDGSTSQSTLGPEPSLLFAQKQNNFTVPHKVKSN
jgi:hypothetical protein